MAGLSNLLTNTTTAQTTLPSWYSTAQQNVVNNAVSGAANAPTLQNTVAGQAINNLSGPNNPFTQAQGALGTIASGAANPWIVNPTTGQVTPNTSTALGGLYAAQNQQLQTLIPQITAPADAAAVASGQFGSLRGTTAADTALTNAQANLAAAQMQSALTNQQTGVNASTALGNIGQQGTATETTLGQAQQAAPLTSTAQLANILSAVNPGATTTNATQLAPINQIGGLLTGLNTGTQGLNALLNTISPGTTIASLVGGLFGNSTPGVGQTTDANGNVITDPTYGNTAASSVMQNAIPDGVTVDPTTGMGSDGVDYSYLLQGP